jgi:hypothetical protein
MIPGSLVYRLVMSDEGSQPVGTGLAATIFDSGEWTTFAFAFVGEVFEPQLYRCNGVVHKFAAPACT